MSKYLVTKIQFAGHRELPVPPLGAGPGGGRLLLRLVLRLAAAVPGMAEYFAIRSMRDPVEMR